MGNSLQIKYVDIERSKCLDKSFKISYKDLSIIAETCVNYTYILMEKEKKIDAMKVYEKALYNFKINEVHNLADIIIKNIHEENFRLPYKRLETIVEMCADCFNILESEREDKIYKDMLYRINAQKIKNIGDMIAGEINYCKSCSRTKRKGDIGAGALELLVNGYDR